jgi:hypothetical protein
MKKTNREKFFFLLIFCLFIVCIIVPFQINPSFVKDPGQPIYTPVPSPTPIYPLGPRNFFSATPFVKRNYDPNEKIIGRDKSVNADPSALIRILSNIPDSNLVNMKCAPRIFVSGNTLFYETSDHRNSLSLNDEQLIAIIKRINNAKPQSEQILSYYICETQNKTLLLNYIFSKGGPDDLDTTYVFLKIENDKSLEVMTSIKIGIYSKCDKFMALTSDGMLYYKCEAGEAAYGHNIYYLMDLKKKTNQLLYKCEIWTDITTNTCP